jgi:hypothetical protein
MRRKIVYLNCSYILCLTLLSISIVTSGQISTTPTASHPDSEDKKADPAAWNLLRSTRDTRYYFGENVAGLTADVVLNDDGKIATGALRYDVGRGADLQIKGEDDETEPWALETILNILGHRRGGDFSKGDGRHPITFAPEDSSPAGRRVLLNDQMQSSYRILTRPGEGDRVTEVDRTVGGDHFTIRVLEETPAGKGRFLPRHFVVTYFDAQTGAIKRSEAFTDEYQKVKGVWVPASRRILIAEQVVNASPSEQVLP